MKHFPSSSDSGQIWPSVVKFLGGSLGAQFLVIASAPLLTRLYSRSEFGSFGVFVSFVALGCTLGTLRYEMAIVLAKRSA